MKNKLKEHDKDFIEKINLIKKLEKGRNDMLEKLKKNWYD